MKKAWLVDMFDQCLGDVVKRALHMCTSTRAGSEGGWQGCEEGEREGERSEREDGEEKEGSLTMGDLSILM